jgi:hypothetical protein
MAKAKQPKQIKELDLFKDIIPSADMGIKELWDAVSDEGRKEIKNSFWVLNRFMSSVKTNNTELEMHYLLAINEYYNKNWFNIQKHPKLVWLSLCVAAHESKKTVFHESIPLKAQQNKKVSILAELFPNMKMDDVNALAEITSTDEIKTHCEKLGWDKKQIDGLKL